MIFLPRVTMNIIDMLAIAPYYITLFFMPGVKTSINDLIVTKEFQQTSPAADLEPPAPGEEVDAEEPSAFAGVGKIMQVDEDNSVGSDCCGRFSVLPASCGCSSWLADLWGSSPSCTL